MFEQATQALRASVGQAHLLGAIALGCLLTALTVALRVKENAAWSKWQRVPLLSLTVSAALLGWSSYRLTSTSDEASRYWDSAEAGHFSGWRTAMLRATDESRRGDRPMFFGVRPRIEVEGEGASKSLRYFITPEGWIRIAFIGSLMLSIAIAVNRRRSGTAPSARLRILGWALSVAVAGTALWQTKKLADLSSLADLDAAVSGS